jgi:hypothetical protein
LVDALTGRFDDHHAFLTTIMLARIDDLTTGVGAVTARIESELAHVPAGPPPAPDRSLRQPGAESVRCRPSRSSAPCTSSRQKVSPSRMVSTVHPPDSASTTNSPLARRTSPACGRVKKSRS